MACLTVEKSICITGEMSRVMTKSAQSDQSLCCRMKKPWTLSYPVSTQRRLWSDWGDAQDDMSLCWAHRSFCWFCHDVAQTKKTIIYLEMVLSWFLPTDRPEFYPLSLVYQTRLVPIYHWNSCNNNSQGYTNWTITTKIKCKHLQLTII